jgi:hypothetical protein
MQKEGAFGDIRRLTNIFNRNRVKSPCEKEFHGRTVDLLSRPLFFSFAAREGRRRWLRSE